MIHLAEAIDPARAKEQAAVLAPSLEAGSIAHAIGVLLATAYPATAASVLADPSMTLRIAREGHAIARDRAGYDARIRERVASSTEDDRVRRELRRFARDERARIALREALPPALGGADVDVTSGELAALADVTIQIAFEDALATVRERFGAPITSRGDARFVVLGMGKLGGDELNAGSDVDLIYFYDTDDGAAGDITLHDFWTRVAKRLTATLEEVTDLGFVWRVDLRLRPEGRTGPIVNSLAAAERYYEAFGRLWERAALLRARPVAGDLAFGAELLAALEPFVWRRRVDPSLAPHMVDLAARSRAELSVNADRDLKLGPGGIREAEFFVQTLELVWGGREPRVRARGTLEGLARLRSMGLVSDREAREVGAAYVALRRAEHAVQVASGIQTHELPPPGADFERVARVLGFADGRAFEADRAAHMRSVASRFLSLVPEGEAAPSRFVEAIAAIERDNSEAFAAALARLSGLAGPDASERGVDLARDLFELSRHPDAPLGARTRERFPSFAEAVLDAVLDAADPELAARTLRMFLARMRQPGVYVKLLADEPRALRKLVEAFGASAFVGDAIVHNPELGDALLFARSTPSPDSVRAEVESATAAAKAADDDDPDEAIVGAIRGAKARATIEISLADLAGEIDTREATLALSALADASLEAATRSALEATGGGTKGLAVIAMGKLGGREIGYGSDLDVLFLFDPDAAPEGKDPDAFFTRAARRIIRLISISHPAGPGYELDTRLRPSGNQGLLVTSLDAFRRYHGVAENASPGAKAHVWERLALLRARFAAGDAELGRAAMDVAHAAAYGGVDDPAAAASEIRRLRARMESESSLERPGRYDLKLGRGGLVDIEFAVQLLQLEHGRDERVRTTETPVAIEALAATGYLAPAHASVLREGYAFLRRLEQRIRIVHAAAAPLVEENALGLPALARRMSIRDRRGREAAQELLTRYRDTTSRVRDTFEAIFSSRAR